MSRLSIVYNSGGSSGIYITTLAGWTTVERQGAKLWEFVVLRLFAGQTVATHSLRARHFLDSHSATHIALLIALHQLIWCHITMM